MITRVNPKNIEPGAITSASIATGAVTVEKIYVEGISSSGVTTATNIADGAANRIPYQTAPGATGFITAPSQSSTYLQWNGSAYTWAASVGPQGPQGPQGPSGVNGSTGPEGPQGPGSPVATQFTITNTTQASSTVTGALQVAGGAGIGGKLYVGGDAVFSSTGTLTVPVGTTAQRPGTPTVGMVRYNTTTGYGEMYTSGGWAVIGQSPPTVTAVGPASYNGESGTTFTITGTNFTNDISVKFIDVNNVEYTAGTVTFLSSTLIQATTPQDFTVAQEPLDVKVSQMSGTATLLDCIDCGGVPSWSTPSGSLATIDDRYGSYVSIATVSASDPDSGATISYSVWSGALPTGCSLNSSSGVISGQPTNTVSGQTTFNFNITATDNAGNTSTRAFSMIVNPALDGAASTRAATSATAIKSLTSTTTDGLYWINLPTVGPTQLYCDMNTSGGGWMHIGTFSDANEARGEVFNTTQQSGGNHPWASPLMASQDTGVWQNTATIGTQSFIADYKNLGWGYYPFRQMLMKDSGATLRNLFYTTNAISTVTMSAFWTARTWSGAGSDTASAAYAAGRVYGLAITNYGVADPVLDSGNKSVMLFKFGEPDGVQDGNKDRSMIAAHRSNTADGLDAPTGIGCFTYHDGSQGGPVQRYRDMVPYANYPINQDEPPNTNGGATTYNYTLWVR